VGDGVRAARVWRAVLGVEHTVIEGVDLESAGTGEVLVARVRPTRSRQSRCGRCGCRAPGYDQGEGRRRWRGVDAGTMRVYLEADAPRVSCAEHGVVVAAVPWARHGSRFTTAFEDTAAWLACHAALTVLAVLLRITWRSVSAIVIRVVAEAAGKRDRLAGLRRIGIDEISYRKGQRYLLCVVDHDTGRLVWAGKNRTAATLREFFDLLGQTRCAQLTHVSCDGAEWIHDVVAERVPQAVLCLDPFHVVAWATTALDAVRRGVWNQLRRRGDTAAASEMKNTRWALLKNPADLTSDQKTTLAAIAKINNPLYRAYLLKEQLRAAFQAKGAPGRALLTGWLAWAQRCRIPEFVKLARTIKRFLPLIHNTLDHGLSNALSEATNTHIRLLTRRAYGYHSPDALIAMATLTRGGLCPPLPGRS
jgi:transposase